MSTTEKIDVLDLIINVLKDHEKRLDELIGKLENKTTTKYYLQLIEKSESIEEIRYLIRQLKRESKILNID